MEIKIIDYGFSNLPVKAHANDAGYDVFTVKPIVLLPHGVTKVPLGFGLEVPPGFMATIYPRSGHTSNGIIAQLPPIDSGYSGEIHAIVLNATSKPVKLSKNIKIGQLVFMPIYHFDLVSETSKQRGQGAFGSTGD